MPRISNFFCDSIAIDLGTVNTLAAVKGKGIVYREPTAVALSCGKCQNPLAVGTEALSFLGRTPGSVRVEYPLRDGVVSDHRLAETMLRHVIGKSMGRRLPGTSVRAVVCVPGCVTDVERRAVEEAAKSAGAREAYLMDEPLAAALGAGLPVYGQQGCMVVDIGGGTTDAAVLALGGIVTCRSVRSGGTHMDDAIVEYVVRRYQLAIGPAVAEQVKLTLGCALPGRSGGVEIQGRDLESGLPRSQRLFAGEVYEALQQPLKKIFGVIHKTLENTPPELAGDLMKNGILLTGGGAELPGLAEAVERKTRIRTRVAESNFECVLRGALLAVENFCDFYGHKRGRNAG